VATAPGLSFRLGGFEVPLEHGAQPTVVRAFNVLRQYDESEVAAAWAQVQSRLAPKGLLVDGTCDELGRRCTWVAVDPDVPGERVHAWLAAVDTAWDHAAHHAGFGARQRFLAAATALRGHGWPVLDGPARWRLGELTVGWDAVAPGAGVQRA
jgi:hypothetical protein